MKYDGDACAFMKTCANAHFCVKLLRLYATCFCAALLFYFVAFTVGIVCLGAKGSGDAALEFNKSAS